MNKMKIVGIRTFCQTTSFKAAPRFTKTLTEASKPPLQNPHVISRPFGFESPRTLNYKGIGFSTFKDFFDKEAKEERQAQLDYELKHSPFYESKSFTNTNGKIFAPPVSYFRGDKAKYFPDFEGNSLTTKHQKLSSLLKGHVSIVRIFSTVSGEKCANTYFTNNDKNYLTKDYSTFKEEFPLSQIIDINIPQNWLKGLFVKAAKGNIKRSLHKDRHNKYFVVPTGMFPFDVKEKLFCDNACSGYTYILDQECKIRWATSGYANEEELKTMWKTVKGLEKELSQLVEEQ